MIKVKNLNFRYRAKRHIFRDFSLSVEAGKIYGLLGSNGIGKSTLLKLIGGTLAPTSGSVEVLGCEARKRTIPMLQNIVFVPEEFALPNINIDKWVATPFWSVRPLHLCNLFGGTI